MVKCRCKRPRWGTFMGEKGRIIKRCKKCLGLPEYRIENKPKVNNTKPLAEQQEGGNGLPPTDKSVGIRPTIL